MSCHNALDISSVHTVNKILDGKEVGCGNCDCAYFYQRHHRVPELIVTLHYQNNVVAFFDTLREEHICRLI